MHSQRAPLCSPDRRARAQAGFSFVELMLVMGILAILVGLALTIVPMGAKARASLLTRQRIAKAALAADAIRMHFGVNAPTDPRKQQARFGLSEALAMPANHTNDGAESLVLAVFAPSMAYDPHFDHGKQSGDLGNTDGDALRTRSGRRLSALLEIRDAWDQPLVYIDSRDYYACQQRPVVYVTAAGERSVRPWKNEDDDFEQPATYQIFSLGPDGEPNTEDDVKHWSN